MCADRTAVALAAVATVHAARLQIVEAISSLAASPLDERAADRMRLALDRAASPKLRAALSKLGEAEESRPPLRLVTTTAGRAGTDRRQAPPVKLVQPCQLSGEGAA